MDLDIKLLFYGKGQPSAVLFHRSILERPTSGVTCRSLPGTLLRLLTFVRKPHLGTPKLTGLVSSRWCCNTSAVTDSPLFGWSQWEREGLTSPTGLT